MFGCDVQTMSYIVCVNHSLCRFFIKIELFEYVINTNKMSLTIGGGGGGGGGAQDVSVIVNFKKYGKLLMLTIS